MEITSVICYKYHFETHQHNFVGNLNIIVTILQEKKQKS